LVDALVHAGLVGGSTEASHAHVLAGPLKVRVDDLLVGSLGRLDESFRLVTAEAITQNNPVDHKRAILDKSPSNPIPARSDVSDNTEIRPH
jgi:hypothetical protein